MLLHLTRQLDGSNPVRDATRCRQTIADERLPWAEMYWSDAPAISTEIVASRSFISDTRRDGVLGQRDVYLEASDEDEASTMVERALAGRLDYDINGVFEEGPGPGQISRDASDSQRDY